MHAFVRRHPFALMLVGAAACWGVATVISKRAVSEIPPLTLLPIQLAASVVLLAVVLLLQRTHITWTPALRRLCALGVLNPGISYALGLAGLVHVTASLSVLLWALEPLLILALARWALGDRVSGGQVVAMLAATVGVVLVVVQARASGSALGAALTLAGVGACAVYTVICRKLLADDTALTVVAVQQCAALGFAVLLFAGSRLTGMSAPIGDVSPSAWVGAATSGMLYYAVAFWLYLAGLRHVPAATAGAFINLVPVFGIAAAYLLLGERFTARQVAGATVVIAAVTAAALLRPGSAGGGSRRAPRVRPRSRP